MGCLYCFGCVREQKTHNYIMEQHTYTAGIYFRIPPGNGIPTIPLVTVSHNDTAMLLKWESKKYVENNYLQILVTSPIFAFTEHYI